MSDPNAANKLVSIKGTAKLLGVSTTTLRKWIKEGCGPPVYEIRSGVRRTLRCRMGDIKAWLLRTRTGGGK